jgi:hypothetical protein
VQIEGDVNAVRRALACFDLVGLRS